MLVFGVYHLEEAGAALFLLAEAHDVSVILTACPKCSRGYKLPSDRVGRQVRCQCGHTWTVEAPPTKAPPSAPLPSPEGRPAPAAKAETTKPESVPLAQPAGPEPSSRNEDGQGQVAPTPRPSPATPSPAVARATAEFKKLVGRSLGTFRIDELLGVGGFGAVFKAFDNSLHRSVAIKVLPSSLARAGKEKVQQFLLEARAAAKLSHPNIVTVHQISEFEHIYFIVMELVEGRSLADLVRRRRLGAQEATRIMTEATRGLAHAHKRGLIHRDIKPGNIMVTGDGQVKMTDFGLARDIFRESEDDADEGRAIGTPLYMSPEQCEGEEGDARSDVYAMGATYYVALTRRPPYEATNTEDLMNHHRFSPPPDPRQVVPALPAAVYRIIEKAMAKDPDERYQSAEELLHAFEGLDFATLDPSASVTADAVAAQISSITPRVGEHVGAAMKEAARQSDKSTSRGQLPDAADKASPLKLYIILGIGVVVLCIAGLVAAIVLSLRDRNPSEDLPPPYESGPRGAVTALSPAAAKPAAATQPRATAPKHPVANAPRPAAATAAAVSPAVTPAASPEAAPVVTAAPAAAAMEPETTAESAEATVPSSDVMAANARDKLKEVQDYEKKAWESSPSSVLQSYQDLIDQYPNTPAAKEAQAAYARLTGANEKKK
jgi:serine/threonine protein kinase